MQIGTVSTCAMSKRRGSFRAPGWDARPLIPRVLRLALLALVVVGVMLTLRNLHPLVGIFGGLAVYAAGVFVGRVLSGEDWDLLYRLVMAMPGGALVGRVWKRDVPLNW